MVRQSVYWSATGWLGLEHLVLTGDGDGWLLDGMVLARFEDEELRVAYRVRCTPGWQVRSLELERLGSGDRLRIERGGDGRWLVEDRLRSDLDGCVDVDLSLTPATNTLPIRRLGLEAGQSAEIRVVYVALPQLEVRAALQRYTCLAADAAGATYRYESGSFQADIRVDSEGLVLDYPDEWRRVDGLKGL